MQFSDDQRRKNNKKWYLKEYSKDKMQKIKHNNPIFALLIASTNPSFFLKTAWVAYADVNMIASMFCWHKKFIRMSFAEKVIATEVFPSEEHETPVKTRIELVSTAPHLACSIALFS